MSGPPRTPTKLLKARGSWLADTRKGEPEFPSEAPTCPMWLDAEAKAEWKRIVPQMLAAGTIARVDRGILVGYCQSWADYYAAVKAVREQGEVFKTPQGYVAKNPWVTIKNEAWSRFNKAAAVLGLSPSARAGLHVEPKRTQKSGKERFFTKSG